jgi:dUTP pyrophosphatase
MEIIKIKYISKDIDKLKKIDIGDWIDLRSSIDIEIKQGENKLIPLGIAMQLPQNYEAYIVPRGSTFKNYGLIQTNHIGIVDNSFCGDGDEWKMSVYATKDTIVHKNDRICQFRIMEKQPLLAIIEVETLGNKNRGEFGSTGIN